APVAMVNSVRALRRVPIRTGAPPGWLDPRARVTYPPNAPNTTLGAHTPMASEKPSPRRQLPNRDAAHTPRAARTARRLPFSLWQVAYAPPSILEVFHDGHRYQTTPLSDRRRPDEQHRGRAACGHVAARSGSAAVAGECHRRSRGGRRGPLYRCPVRNRLPA